MGDGSSDIAAGTYMPNLGARNEVSIDEYREMAVAPKAHKYGAVKTTVDGITFDSKAEAARYQELLILQANGDIAGLTLQPSFLLQEAFKVDGRVRRAIHWTADFSYAVRGEKRFVVEDVKGISTEVFRIKAKLFEKRFPQYVLRITKADGRKRR